MKALLALGVLGVLPLLGSSLDVTRALPFTAELLGHAAIPVELCQPGREGGGR